MQNNSNKTYSKLKAYSALSFLIQCAFFLGKIIEIEDDGVDFMDIGTDGEWDDDNKWNRDRSRLLSGQSEGK